MSICRHQRISPFSRTTWVRGSRTVNSIRLAVLMAFSVLAAGPPSAAVAHHSFATFDNNKTVTLVGTVKTFEWTNPHTWIWLVVTDSKGVDQIWGIEGAAPGELTRHGWTRHSVNTGDKITLDIHPLRDGRAGGSYSRVTFADGHSLSAGPPPPIGAPAPPVDK
jgi:Family of unknown function (DUF6152)